MSRTEESSFSEEKEAKRLLLFGVHASRATYAEEQKFFASFFQKRTVFLLAFARG
jgi:hypothetical protein